MGWSISIKETTKGKKYRVWSSMTDSYLTKWLDREQVIKWLFWVKFQDFAKDFIKENMEFPGGWFKTDGNRIQSNGEEFYGFMRKGSQTPKLFYKKFYEQLDKHGIKLSITDGDITIENLPLTKKKVDDFIPVTSKNQLKPGDTVISRPTMTWSGLFELGSDKLFETTVESLGPGKAVNLKGFGRISWTLLHKKPGDDFILVTSKNQLKPYQKMKKDTNHPTTAIAAKNYDRNFIGLTPDKKFSKLAQKKIGKNGKN